MPRCIVCGNSFKLRDAREEYESRFNGELIYDEDYPDHDYCATCAIGESENLMNQGAAIDMMNGDADYDDDFVKEWL